MNITDDYNDTLSTNITDNYNDTLSPSCTINENRFDIIIPTLLLTVPCDPSILCLMSLIVCTIIKISLNNK